MSDIPAILTFEEAYFERIWGGNRLRERFGKPAPADTPVGEAWLIADHAVHESRVADGPLKGSTLRALLHEQREAVLGAGARLTPHGRFPLLLKLLDAADVLSVQVHPDDDTAARLGEPDVGKTEMWHVLQADPGSELICGIREDASSDGFRAAIEAGTVEDRMVRFPVDQGASVFVASGTVHAIGAGIVLAEIQQNSDLTYRLYDFDRIQPGGGRRPLHIDKALEAIHWNARHSGVNRPLAVETPGATRAMLAACRYFAAERVAVTSDHACDTRGHSFRILLALEGHLTLEAGGASRGLQPMAAAMVAGAQAQYRVKGSGVYLDYYVPDLARDVVAPLRAAGHADRDIVALGGPAATSDLRPHCS